MRSARALWAVVALVALAAAAEPALLEAETETGVSAWLGEVDCPKHCDMSCSCVSKRPNCQALCQQCLLDGVPCGVESPKPPPTALKGRVIKPVPLIRPSMNPRMRALPTPIRKSESSRNSTESSSARSLSVSQLFKDRSQSGRRSESARKSESSRSDSTQRTEASKRTESSKRSESSTPAKSSSSRKSEASRKSESSRSESSRKSSSSSLAPQSAPADKQSKMGQIIELQSKIIAMLQSQSSGQKQQLASQQLLLDQQRQQGSSLSSLVRQAESARRSESSHPRSSESSADSSKRAALLRRLQDIIGMNSASRAFFTSDEAGVQILPITLPVAIPAGSSLSALFGGTGSGSASSSTLADLKSSLSSASSGSGSGSGSGSSGSGKDRAAHEARLGRIVQVLEKLTGWVRARRSQVGEDQFGSEQHIVEVLEQAAALATR